MRLNNIIKAEESLVSVIVNCYNGEIFLREAIDSIINQTYQNWELIFWDNKSSDMSKSIVKSYKDNRIKYFLATKHTKLYQARKAALNKCNGRFISFLDVDDWWAPEKLSQQIKLFNNPKVGLVYSNYWMVNEINNTKKIAYNSELPTGKILSNLLNNYNIGMLTIVIRKSAALELDHIFDTNYHIIGDYDLAIRMADKFEFECIQKPLAFCRWHGNNEQIHQLNKHINELEDWSKKIKSYKTIYNNPKWKNVKWRILKLKIKNYLSIN